jgi:hypothetical protein
MAKAERDDIQLIGDVRGLTRLPAADAVEQLATALTWRYEHALTRARAVAASGAAVILALVVPILAPQGSDGMVLLLPAFGILASGALTIAIGGVLYARARTFHSGLLRAQGLLARLRQAYGTSP